MDVDSRFNREFALLRPVCVELLENPSLGTISELQSILRDQRWSDLGPNGPKNLREYACIPLFEILNSINTIRSENLAIAAVDCVSEAVAVSQVDEAKFFNRLLFNVLATITSKPDPTALRETCGEELKVSAAKCVARLFSSASSSLREKIYGPEYQAPLGHSVYVLLRLTDEREPRGVTLQAIDCLCAVMGDRKDCGEGLLRKIGDGFAAFLPGISVGLAKVIRGSARRGQAVTVRALYGWATCVSLVLDDERVKLSRSSVENNDDSSSSSKGGIVTERNDEWVRSTCEKLKVLADDIATLRSHGGWKVRLALVEWAVVLLRRCRSSLANCFVTLTEILICLSYDEYDAIRSRCEEQLRRLSREPRLTDAMEENLHCLALKLPRIARRLDDSVTVSNVRLLRGCLDILGERLKSLLVSSVLLDRLAVCLIQLTEPDHSDASVIVENVLPFEANSDGKVLVADARSSAFQEKRFKHFKCADVYAEVVAACRALGKYGDSQVLVDHFLERFRESDRDRYQCAFLLNEIVLGLCDDGSSSSRLKEEDDVGNMLEEYLAPRNWDLRTDGDTRNGPRDSTEVRRNVGQLRLLLEGVGNCSKAIGERFRVHLRKVLYPVLEKIEDGSAAVSNSALSALSAVSQSCAYECAADMLVGNCDAYLNPVFVKLRYAPENPSPLAAFRAAIRVGGLRLVPCALDIADDVLGCLDAVYARRSETHLRLLLAVLAAVEKCHPPAPKTAPQTQRRKEDDNDGDELLNYLLGYDELHRRAADIASDAGEMPRAEEENVSFPQDAEEEAPKEAVPLYVETTVKILERCVHLMSAKEPNVRLVVLETVDVGIRVLSDHENHLLPVVHLLWAPLTRRFSDDKTFVIREAFNVLCTMVNVCGDFLRGRFQNEVWRDLLRYLEKQANISFGATKTGPTAERKLVADILRNLGNIAEKLELAELLCAELISATWRFLDAEQPPQVRQAAEVLYEHLDRWCPDLLWLQSHVAGPLQ